MSPLAVVLADTHVPRRARALPEGLQVHLEKADLILHAGDLMDPKLLDEFGGAKVAMIHDSGPGKGRRNRMGRRFPEARVVVFGHSHIPWLGDEDGLLNPGSPTDKRRQPDYTLAFLTVEEGNVRAEIAVL